LELLAAVYSNSQTPKLLKPKCHRMKVSQTELNLLVLLKEQNLEGRNKIKDDQWFTMYGELVTKFEN
jgi:hypothetical protein